MTTHEWKGERITTSGGTVASTFQNPVSIQSTGIPLVIGNVGATRGVSIYEAASTEWLIAGFGTVFTLKTTMSLTPNIDLGTSVGSSTLRWLASWAGTGNTKTHAAFAGSQAVVATGAIQTTGAVTTTAFTSPTLLDNSGTMVEVSVVARDAGGANRGAAVRRALITRQAGGAATLIGVVQDDLTNMPAAWGGGVALTQCTIGVTGNTFIVQVQGAAATNINWAVTARYQTVSGNT